MGIDNLRNAAPQPTHRQSATQEPAANGSESPQLLACVLILPSDAEPIVSLVRNLAASLPCTAAFPLVAGTGRPLAQAPTGCRLPRHFAKSTLYQYASQKKIECRKLGGRLEYHRSTLDQFKDQQIRPAHRWFSPRSIIPPALGSGK